MTPGPCSAVRAPAGRDPAATVALAAEEKLDFLPVQCPRKAWGRRSGPAGSLIGAVAGGSLGQRFGLLSGFRVLAALYAVLMVWHGRGVMTENDQPVALAEGESE